MQLAHNEWDPVRKCSVARVVHSFGREDQLDRAALARLAKAALARQGRYHTVGECPRICVGMSELESHVYEHAQQDR